MFDWIFRRKYVLTHEQAERYASEKDDNFRWISSLFATFSNYTLTDDDLVSEDLHNEITQLGQFAELVYSAVPVQFLIENYSTLSQPHYPLEKYDTLRDCLFVDAFRGTCADLPAFIVFQPFSRRLVVSIAGSTSITHMLHNVRCYRTAHPSGRGQVHSGFLRLYEGIKNLLFDGIRRGVEKYSPTELILTGHSMGASIVYLFIIELLAQDDPILPRVKLSACIFGSPRVGDSDLVDHFLTLVRSFRERFGQDAFREYSIKGYNDGITAVPPFWSGYRHFCREPLYTIWGKLYRIPAVEDEHSEFHVQVDGNDKDGAHIFPMGGHNYYCRRDLEQFKLRTTWLVETGAPKEGWESQYMAIAQ